MDIKTKLQDEEYFMTFLQASQRVEKVPTMNIINLAKRNIITVEDFINTDVSEMCKDRGQRERYRLIQEILRYKYTGQKLVSDIVLSEPILNFSERGVFETLLDLGIRLEYQDTMTSIVNASSKDSKGIDIVRSFQQNGQLERKSRLELAKFYVDYYEKEMVSEKEESLQSVKEQLEYVIGYKNKLEEEIAVLKEKVDSLEKGKSNGRK